jgi:glycosyltransferase involved in cell wall biosynthesis
MTKTIQIGMHAGCAGGVDRYFDGLCRAFDRNGIPYQGHVFLRGSAEDEIDLPSGVSLMGRADAPVLERWSGLREAVGKSLQAGAGSQLAVSHFALYGWPLLNLRRRGLHLISHFHGPWADESQAEGASKLTVLAKRFLERRVYRGSGRVISDSEAFRQVAIARYGLHPERVRAVLAGIDQSPISAATEGVSRRGARERLGWPVDRRIFFTVRRLTRRMGLETLIDAVGVLAPDFPELLVVIGGRGPIREELEARVERLGLGAWVRFAGFVPDADLPLAYRAAECTVVPSVALEGFGLIILESWAAGTPVLATPVGGMPEVVRPFRADCVLDGATLGDVVRGLRRVLTGEHCLPETEDCVAHVRRYHGWDEVTRRVTSIYGEIGVA